MAAGVGRGESLIDCRVPLLLILRASAAMTITSGQSRCCFVTTTALQCCRVHGMQPASEEAHGSQPHRTPTNLSMPRREIAARCTPGVLPILQGMRQSRCVASLSYLSPDMQGTMQCKSS
ncbi:hypothetical protein BDY17DRAFT_302011 [Neohortaea acidophila]|uniref:Secreted protein n=1 Tax=Neohortaea acidophila TaxID=245834 RepID=A0A6A6PMS2_9PEZI|nr:uncharacterized protein BDY17DRAFT_302011 [Neohortaea acidophila]KAF2480557.1 hypothetical protein BDY17DRAFT_302011 [Neohortaea acidophila]